MAVSELDQKKSGFNLNKLLDFRYVNLEINVKNTLRRLTVKSKT